MRTEVLNTGFDPIAYGARINDYLNNAQQSVARQVDFYADEAVQTVTTTVGVAKYAWATDLARVRSLFNSVTNVELQYVGLKDIDRSVAQSGEPRYYATDGLNFHFFPTPDSATYTLTARYWKLPATLVADTDVPVLPTDYHNMLISYALWQCYERDDDIQTAQYHQKVFKGMLAEFATDVKFPTSDEPHQVRGMWEQAPTLGGSSVWGGGDY